ncbi:MAG: DUF2207 domain-containing protein [Bacilli bacterium]|nr:DUF2207 domain-containing protein [Bacilli bacterium]
MKKIILCFYIFFFGMFTVDASSKNEVLYNYIDATVQSNGDISVKELVVVSGTIEDYHKSLLYRNSRLEKHDEIDYLRDAIYNATSIEDISISIKNFSSTKIYYKNLFDKDFEPLEKFYFKEDIEEMGYIESSIQDGKYYKFYSNQKNTITGLLFEYTLKNVVVLHNDIAEIYSAFFPTLESDLSYLEIRVHVGEQVDYLKMWAHGDLSSQVTKIDDTAIATYSKLSKNTQLSFRVVFSKDNLSITNPLKQSKVSSLKNIVELEEKNTHQMNIQKKQTKIAHKVIFTSDVLLIIVLFFYWIFVFIKYDKEKELLIPKQLPAHIESSYGIEVLDLFWNKKERVESFLISTLHLVLKENIEYDRNKHLFTLKSKKNLTESQEYLIEMLFDQKKTMKESDFFVFLKMIHTPKYEDKKYQNWKYYVHVEYNKQKFYEQNGLPTISAVFFLLLSVFVLMASIYFKVDFILSLFLVCSCLLFLIYTFLISKKTKKGREEYAKWSLVEETMQRNPELMQKNPELEEYAIYSLVFEQQNNIIPLLNNDSLAFQCLEIYKHYEKEGTSRNE